MKRRTVGPSMPTGFSIKACLLAATAFSKCSARKPGGVVRMTTSTSIASTLSIASRPTNLCASSTFTLSPTPGRRFRFSWLFSIWSAAMSAMAASSIFESACSAWLAAPVPRPPQPMSAIFSVLPASFSRPGWTPEAMAVPSAAAAVVPRNVRRSRERGERGFIEEGMKRLASGMGLSSG